MAALIVRIEESREQSPNGQEMVGFSIYDTYDGDLQIGDALPGVRPLIQRAVRQAIDMVFGAPVSVSDESIEEARKQLFIN